MKLLENTGIKKLVIELVKSKQSAFRLIYSLSLVELETLKTYIKTHLKIKFILLIKFLLGVSILFDKKFDESL